MVGAGGGPVTLHNVANGQLASGSTEAVNGGQLHETNRALASLTVEVATQQLEIANLYTLIGAGPAANGGPVQYSDAGAPTAPNGGTVTSHVTLVGADGAPVALHNLADGAVAAGSTDAVNGGQLHAVTVQVAETRAVADEAVVLARNSVQYDPDGSVTFGDGAQPVVLHNVAAGTAPTDAVNVAQLDAGMQSTLIQANAYTDIQISRLGQDMTILRRDLEGGIAGALARPRACLRPAIRVAA